MPQPPLYVNTAPKNQTLYETQHTHIQAYPDPPDGICETLSHPLTIQLPLPWTIF